MFRALGRLIEVPGGAGVSGCEWGRMGSERGTDSALKGAKKARAAQGAKLTKLTHGKRALSPASAQDCAVFGLESEVDR